MAVSARASEHHIPRADLHTHSTASDGADAPADLIRQASERGLSVLALTDHDTTLGLAEAMTAGREHGVRVIPGIELSTDVEHGELHLLGYGFDPEDQTLQRQAETLRAARLTRADSILTKLAELGLPVDPADVQPATAGASIGRPHIARAMIRAGYVDSVAEAFDRYLGQGGPAYVASKKLTPADAIALVRQVGGVPVMAHPYSYPALDDVLPHLIAAGLRGIEVYYAEYSEQQRADLAALAARNGLLATGGSDYHGASVRAGRLLGGVVLPEPVLAAFLAAIDG